MNVPFSVVFHFLCPMKKSVNLRFGYTPIYCDERHCSIEYYAVMYSVAEIKSCSRQGMDKFSSLSHVEQYYFGQKNKETKSVSVLPGSCHVTSETWNACIDG
jgi:hypothetical protein